MNAALLQNIVDAVLYEGYVLYPYRASAKKNARERFTFGRVYPAAYSAAQNESEPCVMQTECLVRCTTESPILSVSIGFLHPMAREVAVTRPRGTGGKPDEFQIWHEAVERRILAPDLLLKKAESYRLKIPFGFSESRESKPMNNGQYSGSILRRQESIEGAVELSVEPLELRLLKVTVRILNLTPLAPGELNEPEPVLMRTLASTHTILKLQGGEFVSLMDPPDDCKTAASTCRNLGTWPVLVGDEAQRESDTMLSSPIILYDYPKIAPESAGPLFDGTEIDEILSLRILTMTDDEKREMRQVDDHTRQLLERTETLSQEALLRMHGIMRQAETSRQVEFDDFFGAGTPLKGVSVGGTFLQAGDRVRLRPRARADVIDMALAGQTAVIEAVEQDLEKRIHLAVVLDNDPGKDLGMLRQPGHRFFYGVDEIEPLIEGVR